MINAEILVKRPGSKSSLKKYPSVDLHALPREGETLEYMNHIIDVDIALTILKVHHEFYINQQGEFAQRAYLYCEHRNESWLDLES